MLDEYAVLRMRRAELAEATRPGRRSTKRAGRTRPTRPGRPSSAPGTTAKDAR
ncbi:hypothetical protein [Nakamurella aerolata]|uniref:Uncharacterized protein n=1 Tax=Nakamurella aerolata TaxID=1656892 RepID=A0A849AHS7_9ACTN|nr:hypothetical protein [Nakamurella aerolata]NNG36382.1 hypothetical protein [Nakamurella aerolata]